MYYTTTILIIMLRDYKDEETKKRILAFIKNKQNDLK
jgi:hypothetical protein